MILGSGPKRKSLIDLVSDLNLGDVVEFHGFVENPYAFMKRASLFVLSSAFEGSPNVLVEAMACGCSVVSADCPSGPAEILADGAFGSLVPVGDDAALARAVLEALDAPPDPAPLRERASEFSVERAADAYLEVLRAVT